MDRLYIKRKLKHPPDHETHVLYKEYGYRFNEIKIISKQEYFSKLFNKLKETSKQYGILFIRCLEGQKTKWE